jgi:hypothetical protein
VSPGADEGEESIEGGLEGTGVALDLGEEKPALKGREQRHGEIIGIEAGRELPLRIQRAQSLGKGG